jgi:uncharacterized damage-inducible protein DinB
MVGATRCGKCVIRLGTLHELFAFNDWARDAVMGCAVGLSKEQLDCPFEMGPGSLRNTLNHLYAVESVWLDRWQGKQPRYRVSAEGVEMASLWDEWRDIARRRNAFLADGNDVDLVRDLTYINIKGETFTFPLGAMMLHVCNHGSYHRAQVLNMLRHVGSVLPKPETDYIFMKLHNPEGTPGRLDFDTAHSYLRYSDWAQEKMLQAAAPLNDEKLDRKFEMGVGSLRQTLAHLRDAEQWWLTNWTKGPGELFPENPSNEPIEAIASSFRRTREARNDFLRSLTDADLTRRIDATPRPGMIRSFPLGVTLLQICHHGTHHRAQAVNMLRHLGARMPALDVLEMLKP